jgi:hypothetical protein
MEQRRHRLAVLMLVVALHVPALMALRGWLQPRAAGQDKPLVVEFVLNEAAPPPPPSPPHRRSRESGNPATSVVREALTQEPESLHSRFRGNDESPVRLFSDDGSLRISPSLAEQIAPPPAAEASNTFHIPAGDTWVLREPAAPVEFRDTIFAQAFVPDDMNPIEEACWRNKGLAFILTMLGSSDCAAPGEKARVPPPDLIVYGVDDGKEILRKHAAWERYNAR